MQTNTTELSLNDTKGGARVQMKKLPLKNLNKKAAVQKSINPPKQAKLIANI